MRNIIRALKWFVSDRDGREVVAQFPNPPLIVWFAALVLARLFSGGFSTVLELVSKGALVVWAVWELTAGDSPFRRALGVSVLVYQVLAVLFW